MTPEDIELIRTIFREELQRIVEAPKREPKREWYDVKHALDILGISPDYFRDLINTGFFQMGTEVRDVRSPGSAKPKYQFHASNAQSKLNQHPAKRRVKKTA